MAEAPRGTAQAMKTPLSKKTPPPPPPAELTPEQARNAVGALSVALGAAAVLAPRTTARAFGVRGGLELPLLTRMVGVRNLTMGLRTVQATGDEQARAVQAGLVVGAVDVLAVLAAASKGAISGRAAVGVLVVLGGIAALGVAAGQD
jgi:hypothetical protein